MPFRNKGPLDLSERLTKKKADKKLSRRVLWSFPHASSPQQTTPPTMPRTVKRRKMVARPEPQQPKPINIAELQRKIAQCSGVEMILRCKIWQRELERAQREQVKTEPQALPQAPPRKVPSTPIIRSTKPRTIPLGHRLLPNRGGTRRSIFDSMTERDAQRWQVQRTQQKRASVLQKHSGGVGRLEPRRNPIDTCVNCGVDRVVDKELAITVCPKCGSNREFASHIFDTKEVDKEAHPPKQQTLTHLQKFSGQFERGFPATPLSVYDTLSVAYQKIHFHDPSKVQASRTATFLKTLPGIPKTFRRAPDRLTLELKGQSIPEYTLQELTLLQNQRTRLQTADTDDPTAPHKKSFSNQMYMRQLGRANQMEQSRLFQLPKTNAIHLKRARALEEECESTRHQASASATTTATPMSWSIYPTS